MRRCFKMDLRVDNGCTLLMVFDAMKRMQQESSLIDESVSISYDDKIKITAGLYNNFDEFDDIFMSIIFHDKELIKKHVKEVISQCQDSDVVKSAIDNICKSMENSDYKYSEEEKEELYRLANSKAKVKRKIIKK